MRIMKQTAHIISTYASDVSGVCSALFELGGMTIMHDASGCNSTYNTHDEPRWYDMDSMVYISGLSEMEAIMGDDDKLIDDIIDAAINLKPNFIAIAGSPVPMMIGTDFSAIASIIEKRTSIMTFGFSTNGMHSYISGASMALSALARRIVLDNIPKTPNISVNILGVTPLDYSTNSTLASLKAYLVDSGILINSCFAMGSTYEQIQHASAAHVNLVASFAGMQAALDMYTRFNIPYVVGIPIIYHGCEDYAKKVIADIYSADSSGNNIISFANRPTLDSTDITIIGESIVASSMASAITAKSNKSVRVICPVETDIALLNCQDVMAIDEDELIPLLADSKTFIADPMYKPICNASATFIGLGHEGFSGRIYSKDIPDLIHGLL